MKKQTFSILFLFFFIANNVLAQNEIGIPLLRNFTPKEYGGAPQNLSLIQDNRGFIIFGNTDGVIEYDGTSWRVYESQYTPRVMSKSKNGRIYFNNDGYHAYLSYKDNEFKVKSFEHIQDSSSLFHGTATCNLKFKNKIYLLSTKKLFVYDPSEDNLDVFDCPNERSMWVMFDIKDKLYFPISRYGLYELKKDSFHLVHNYGLFKDITVRYINKVNNDSLIVFSNSSIYTYNFKNHTHTEIELSPVLNEVFSGGNIYDITLSNDSLYYSISTRRNGFVVVDNNFNLISKVSTDNGLLNNFVWATIIDKDNNIWAGTNKGISKVDALSPLSYWSEKNGLIGIVEDIIKHHGVVYVATHNSIYYLKNDKAYQMQGIDDDQCWTFSKYITNNNDTILLACTSSGVYEIQNTETPLKRVVVRGHSFCIKPSKKDHNILFIPQGDGVSAVRYDDGAWTDIGYMEGTEDNNRDLVEDNEGNLWVGTFRNGFMKIELNYDDLTKPKSVKYYKEKDGLGSLKNCLPYQLGDKIVYVSGDGIYKYNKKEDKFEHDCTFGEQYCTGDIGVYLFVETSNNQVLISGLYNERSPIAIGTQQENGTWNWFDKPFKKVPGMFLLAAYMEDNGTIWVGGSEGLYKYNPNIKKNYNYNSKAYVRKVMINSDSIIYNGACKGASDYNDSVISYNFPYKYNSVIFEFATNDYEDLEKRIFSYKLDGFDEEWSNWSSKTLKEYTNLREGNYRFLVKSKNIYGKESELDVFEFSIDAPWYRTLWAFLCYIVFGGIIIYIVIKLYTRRLIKEKERLESIVKERTKEISKQNAQLKQQKEEMQVQAENLQIANNEILKQSEELRKLSIVASETDNAVMIMDKEGNFEWANEGFHKLYGYTLEEYIQKNGKNINKVSANEKIKELLKKCFTEQKSTIYESMMMTKAGEPIWSQTTLTPIKNDKGEVDKIVAIDSDIRKLKAFEKEILQKNEEILQANEEITAQKEAIEEQNLRINEQNELIRSSIRYAQSIQSAILPSKSEIDEYFESAIIYKPKDIVSGDFYWFNKKDNEIFIAVSDCTGHGVPGAFMSMIGNQLLKDIIFEKNITSPADILDTLDLEIKSALKQDVTENIDGMDIILCKLIEHKNRYEVTFASSKTYLLFYKKELNSFERIKGDRKRVGGVFLTKNLRFENKQIILKKGDIIYLFSDGFADQNNEARKRFGTKRLMHLLEANTNLPLSEQKNILEKKLIEWSKNTDQRDDITMLALRLKN